MPGHLYHAFTGLEKAKPSGMRKKLNAAFDHFQEKQFRPLASLAIRYRAVTVAACLGLVIFSASLFAGGLVKYRFFPSAEGTIVNANIAFIAGTPPEAARAYADNLVAALKKTEAEFPDEENLIRHVKVNFGEGIGRSDDGPPSSGDEYAGIQIELSDPENRSARADQVAASWEKHAPRIAGLESLVIESQRGGPPGGDLAVRLQGEDLNNLKAAALEVREVFGGLPGVSLPDDDMPFGKPQIAFELSPLGRSLGLSTREVAAQLRDALDGYKAQTFYEGVDEIDVRVLMDGGDASGHLRSFPVRLPGGGFASLEDVADLRTRRGFDSITRIDGRAAVNVSGKVDFSVVDDLQGVIRSLRDNELPDIAGRHGVDFSFEGQQADQKQTIADMKIGLAMAMVFIYIILTWVFASWSIPLVVMVTMPLGVIGAILGHWVMGAAMSILSFFGVFALMGIIVNDSIVLVKYFQEQRRLYPNMSADELILGSACRRLRAVVVTSLTTIAGLLPLMFETSTQGAIFNSDGDFHLLRTGVCDRPDFAFHSGLPVLSSVANWPAPRRPPSRRHQSPCLLQGVIFSASHKKRDGQRQSKKQLAPQFTPPLPFPRKRESLRRQPHSPTSDHYSSRNFPLSREEIPAYAGMEGGGGGNGIGGGNGMTGGICAAKMHII